MKTLMIFLMLLGGVCQAQVQDSIIDPYPGLDPNWGRISPWMKNYNDSIRKLNEQAIIDSSRSPYITDYGTWTIDSIYIDNDTIVVYTNRDTLRPVYNYDITLQDLIDYQKDCYNDSTHVGTILYLGQDSIIDGNIVGTIWDTREEFAHLHYPTFEGFIEYMKRKSR